MFLFQHFGLPAQIKRELERTCMERTGEHGLLLEDFHDRVLDLPIWLVRGRFRKLPKTLTISTMFNSFSSQPFVTAYQDLYAGLDEGLVASRTFGLVHPWPYIPQGMVLHNRPPELLVPGVRMQCVIGTKKKREILTWEPLVNLLHAIDADAGGKWRPIDEGIDENG